MRFPTTLAITATTIGLGLLLAGEPSLAQSLDWQEIDGFDVIEVITQDEDGDVRESKAWIGVVDGLGYVRTNDSRWFVNILRDPKIVLRAGEHEYPMQADVIDDPTLRERVDDAFREKYGWQVSMMEFFGGTGGKNLLRLSPRSPGD